MLSQELRPFVFDEMAGQKENISILKAIIKNPEQAPKCLIFAGAFGSGKCIEGNTRVLTSKGYLRIKDLIDNPVFDEEGFMDISDQHIRVLGNQEASHFYYGGMSNTITISGKRFSLTGTPEHKVLGFTDNGVEWKKLSDFSIGDFVCLDIEDRDLQPLPFNNKTDDIPYFKYNDSEFEKGYLIGALLGDGLVEGGTSNRTIIMGTKEQCIEFQSSFITEGYDYKEVHTKVIDRTNGGTNSGYYDFEIVSFKLKQWFKEHNLLGNSRDRVMPEWVFSSNAEFLKGILSGLYDTDGSVGKIDFAVISKNLAEGFRDILNLFGITTTFTSKRIDDKYYVKGNIHNNHNYRVLVYGLHDSEKVAKIFRCKLKYKQDYLLEQAVLPNTKNTCHNNRDLIPRTKFFNDEVERLYQIAKSCHTGGKDSGNQWGYARANTKEFTLRENKRQKRASVMSWYNLRRLVEEKYNYYDFTSKIDEWVEKYRFVEVENIGYGQHEVYDLTVPNTHAFMAGGLINHNTTSARILARELNSIKDRDFDLLNSRFYYEYDSTVIGNVDTIRQLRDQFLISYGDYYRVIVLDEVHAVSSAGQGALLKVFEEVQGRVFFVLCTTDPQKLLPTIRSRSLELDFKTVPRDDIFDNLTRVSDERGLNLSDDVKHLIADRSGGHMRNAHMLIDKYLLLGEQDFKDSIKSAITYYCFFLISAKSGQSEKVKFAINTLMNMPMDDLKADWSTVMTESMKGYTGLEVNHSDIKVLMQSYTKQEFEVVVRCYFEPWIRNMFLDMPYFQATMLNIYSVIQKAMSAQSSESGTTQAQDNLGYDPRAFKK